MKYEIIVRATCEWAYTVAAPTPKAAATKLQRAIDNGFEGTFAAQIYDTGTLEIVSEPSRI